MLLAAVIAESVAIVLLMMFLAIMFNYAICLVCSTAPLTNYPDICTSFSTIMWWIYLLLLLAVIAYIAICVLIALVSYRQ